MAAQNFCEDFAPRNEAARLCWERGANRAAEMPAEGMRRRGISVKILLPGTVTQGFAGGWGANRAAEKAAGGRRRRGISVKILLPGTVARQYR